MNLDHKSFNRLILAAVAVGFACLTAVGLTAAWLVGRNQDDSRWVSHTYEVQRDIADVRVLFEQAEAAERGYLLNGGDYSYRTYVATIAALPAALSRLPPLVIDNPVQERNALAMSRLVGANIDGLERTVALMREGRAQDARSLYDAQRSTELVSDVRQLADRMTAEENRLLGERMARQHGNFHVLISVLALAGLMLAAVAIASVLVIQNYMRNLNASRSDLHQLNEGLEDSVRERTADLARANDEIQRFAYIVSHDLRSPLVNVMGFTSELDAVLPSLRKLIADAEGAAPQIVSAEVRTAVEADIPESLGFIRSSTAKMDRLINAILALSRQGRRVLSPERVSMNTLVTGVIDSLHHRLADTGAQVLIEGDLPDLISDRLAVEQVFSNVIENAVKYLKPGRPGRIVVRGRTEARRRIYEVQDNGRGIHPRDHERVFELFRRAGVQDQAGEGIGLAHVRALIYRLGGVISVASELDQGATFRISLPLALKPDQAPST